MAYPIHSVTLPADLVGATNGKLTFQLVEQWFDGRGNLRIHSQFQRAWAALYAACWIETGVVLTAVSAGDAYRTYEQQYAVFKQRYVTTPVAGSTSIRYFEGKTWYLKKGFAQVATPGTSNHGLGLALDVAEWRIDHVVGIASSPAWNWLLANADSFGLSWEVQSEPWHIRLYVGDNPTQRVIDFEQPVPVPDPDPPPDPPPVPPDPDPQPDPYDGWPETPKPLTIKGHSGPVVQYLQSVLRDKLAYVITADGQFGARTEQFVIWFQATHGLVADGKVGPKTWALVDIIARS